MTYIQITIVWLIIALFCLYKQIMSLKDSSQEFKSNETTAFIIFIAIIFISAPFYLIGAIIRQVIVDPWK